MASDSKANGSHQPLPPPQPPPDGPGRPQPSSSPRFNRSSSPARTSLTGLTPHQQGNKPGPLRNASMRMSSPGHLGSLPVPMSAAAERRLSGSGAASHSAVSTSCAPSGDLLKLPSVNEAPERRASGGMVLKKSQTLRDPPTHTRDVPLVAVGGESLFLVKKERNALQNDKHVLLQNKRRLEVLLRSLLQHQGPLPDEATGPHAATAAAVAGGQQGGVTARAAGGRQGQGQLRGQIQRALEDSAAADKQLGAVGAASATQEADSRIKELTEQIAEMKLDHEVAVSRLEGEMAYRRTQATAAAATLQAQLKEAQEEAERLRRMLMQTEGHANVLTVQSAELRRQIHTLTSALQDKAKNLADTRDMVGMDKATMNTVIEMLKEQLAAANADRAIKAQQISELELAVVHRDNLLAEAARQQQQKAGGGGGGDGGRSSPDGDGGAAVVGSLSGGVGAKGTWAALSKTVAAHAAATREGRAISGSLPCIVPVGGRGAGVEGADGLAAARGDGE